jgi:tetracycline repressor-like protein
MATDSDDGNPALRRKARRAFGSWLGRLRSIVEEGQPRGEIRPGVNPAELSTLAAFDLPGVNTF